MRYLALLLVTLAIYVAYDFLTSLGITPERVILIMGSK